jgi:hypothetical protein
MELSRDEYVNRGYRLTSLTSSPGYIDLQRIAEALIQRARDAYERFEGWDAMQILALQQRIKTSIEFRDQLFATVNQQIEASRQQELSIHAEEHSAKPEMQKADEADELRAKALALFESMNPTPESDGRIAGTF